jgi:hypothetical protein
MQQRDFNYVGIFDMLSILEHIYDYLQCNNLYNTYSKQYEKYFSCFIKNILKKCESKPDYLMDANNKIQHLYEKINLKHKYTNKKLLKWFFQIHNETNYKVLKIFGIKIKLNKKKLSKIKKWLPI